MHSENLNKSQIQENFTQSHLASFFSISLNLFSLISLNLNSFSRGLSVLSDLFYRILSMKLASNVVLLLCFSNQSVISCCLSSKAPDCFFSVCWTKHSLSLVGLNYILISVAGTRSSFSSVVVISVINSLVSGSSFDSSAISIAIPSCSASSISISGSVLIISSPECSLRTESQFQIFSGLKSFFGLMTFQSNLSLWMDGEHESRIESCVWSPSSRRMLRQFNTLGDGDALRGDTR